MNVENLGQRPRFSTPPRDLASVNEWKIMFDPYIQMQQNGYNYNKLKVKREEWVAKFTDAYNAYCLIISFYSVLSPFLNRFARA